MTENKLQEIDKQAEEIYQNMCKQLGEYFNYVREYKEISLRELNRLSGISIALISSIENGEKLPRIETLLRLILALNVPFQDVFGRKTTGMEFKFNPNSTARDREDNPLRKLLLTMDFDKDEVKDIIKYTEFIKYNRK